jgi:hypothetical protein
MIGEVKVFQVEFDVKTSSLADIFANDTARALWCMYKANHIISGDGLAYLNQVCRELILSDKIPFDAGSARKFLTSFLNNLDWIEHSRNDNTKWIDNTIPYMVGEIKVEIQQIDKKGNVIG